MDSKKPSARVDPQTGKTPKIGFDENPRKLKPAWRIGSLEMCDPFGWHVVDQATLHEIREKLKNFESMTLGELVSPKKKSHMVEVWKLCKDAKDRLNELHLDDIDELVSLRLGGRKRVWGIVEHNIIILLWWDPSHLVCPSLKD